MTLIKKQPKRLFTFGCSFTKWIWPTWANVIAYELDVPLYNYGYSGAGNQYIFNAIIQADSHYKFNDEDLIMVCWTNVCREDRLHNGHWLCPGNIYTQGIYDQSCVKKWADPFGYAVRDFASIKATWELLDKTGCQFHFMKMLDFENIDQFNLDNKENFSKLENIYDYYLVKIKKSFYEVLWNNNLDNKYKKEKELFGEKYHDGHPTIKEHLIYLENVFDYTFSEKTKNIVNQTYNDIIREIAIQHCNKVNSWQINLKKYYFNNSEPTFLIGTRYGE